MQLIVTTVVASSLSWTMGVAMGQGSARLEPVENTSGVKAVEHSTGTGPTVLFECRGLDKHADDLDDTGLTMRDLAKPVSCVAADLDGNGEMDFAVWGRMLDRGTSGQAGAVPTRKFKVLFFEDGKVHKEQMIVNAGRDHIWLYPPQKESDEFGSPASELPGLIQSGEGGPTFYYIFDASSGSLHKIETQSEWR